MFIHVINLTNVAVSIDIISTDCVYTQESAQTIYLVTADCFTPCKLPSCCLCKYHGPQTCEPRKVRSGGVVLLSADGLSVLKSTLSCAIV